MQTNNISKLKKEQRWTFQAIGDHVGITRQAVRQQMTAPSIKFEHAKKYAEFFGVDYNELMGWPVNNE